MGLAQGLGEVLHAAAWRSQNEIEEWRDAMIECRAQHRLDVAMDLRLVEVAERVLREILDTEAQHPKSGPAHGRQALERHGIDAVCADELQLPRNRATLLRRCDRLTQRQNAP